MADQSRAYTAEELQRLREKFGPFPFGVPSFGDWPAAAPVDAGTGGGGVMPGPSPRVGGWRSRGRVTMRAGSVRSEFIERQRATSIQAQAVAAVIAAMMRDK